MKHFRIYTLLALCLLTLRFPLAAQDDGNTIVIGVVLPFTGPLGSVGQDFARGAELAVEQMNAELTRAGVETHFEIVTADTTGTPNGAAEAVETIVQTTGAQIIVGPLTTAEVLGAKQTAEDEGIVLVAPVSASSAAAIPNDNIFRVMNPPDSFSARAFVALAEARGYQNIAILHMDEPYGNSMAEQFSNGFAALNHGSVSVIKYAPNPADLSAEATALSAEIGTLSSSGDTAFFCVCYLEDAKKLIQVAQIDPILSEVDWIGIENLYQPTLLEDATLANFLGSVNFTAVALARMSTPLTQSFIDAFVAKYGNPPVPYTNATFDATNIAMRAALMAGNDGEAIKSLLPYVSSYYIGTSVQGYLDENGDQALAYYGFYTVDPAQAAFVQIGSFDSITSELELTAAE
jgi:branched-chain amino acid transport system substrate-binding protein